MKTAARSILCRVFLLVLLVWALAAGTACADEVASMRSC